MTTDLKTPVPPPSDIDNDGGDDAEESFYLDAFGETALTPKLMELTKEVNPDSCENAAVIKTRTGRFFLMWEERHPENVSLFEYCAGKPKPESMQDWEDYWKQSALGSMSDLPVTGNRAIGTSDASTTSFAKSSRRKSANYRLRENRRLRCWWRTIFDQMAEG